MLNWVVFFCYSTCRCWKFSTSFFLLFCIMMLIIFSDNLWSWCFLVGVCCFNSVFHVHSLFLLLITGEISCVEIFLIIYIYLLTFPLIFVYKTIPGEVVHIAYVLEFHKKRLSYISFYIYIGYVCISEQCVITCTARMH